MGHMTKVSTQIHSTIPQFDVYNVWLKKNEWKVPFGGVKVDIFPPWAQLVGLNICFWWFSVMSSSQIYANNTEATVNQNTCVYV